MLVGSVAKGRVSRQLTVAQFVVARIINVEGDGATPSHDPFALSIAPGRVLGVPAGAVVVDLPSVEIYVGRE